MCLPDAVLITRPEPGASQTAVRVAALGFEPVMAPALAIEPADPKLPACGKIAAVLVTSGNALAACLPAFRDSLVITVGDATAARARGMGFSRVVSAAGDGDALAGLVARDRPIGEGSLLLAVGQGHGVALATTLRRHGFRVVRRVTYRACPTNALPDAAVAALRAGRVRAALFFSADTARAFVTTVQQSALTETVRTIDALAIGAAAGVALQALPWRRIGVAAQPNQDAMLAQLR